MNVSPTATTNLFINYKRDRVTESKFIEMDTKNPCSTSQIPKRRYRIKNTSKKFNIFRH